MKSFSSGRTFQKLLVLSIIVVASGYLMVPRTSVPHPGPQPDGITAVETGSSGKLSEYDRELAAYQNYINHEDRRQRILDYFANTKLMISTMKTDHPALFYLSTILLSLTALSLLLIKTAKAFGRKSPRIDNEIMQRTRVKPTKDINEASFGEVHIEGKFDIFSQISLIQMLSQDMESGLLRIISDDNDWAGSIFMQKGAIIDAQTKTQRGENSALSILRNRHNGSFKFYSKDNSNRPITIQQSTMSLLLEAQRLADEEKERELNFDSYEGQDLDWRQSESMLIEACAKYSDNDSE